MKTALTTLCFSLSLLAAPALASEAARTEANPVVVALFLGLLGTIILFQLIPGLLLFVTMLKGLFGKAPAGSNSDGR